MKKSFLKRVAAAAVAVPVALTQTALFTSFAAGETAEDKTLGVATVKNINPDAAKLIPAGDLPEYYQAKELGEDYAYVQSSEWYKKLDNAVTAVADGTKRAIDAGELFDEVSSNNKYVDLMKAAIDHDKTVATVEANRGKVTVTVDAVLDVRAAIQEVADQNDVDMTFPDRGSYTATMVMTADTSYLSKNGYIPFEIKFADTATGEAADIQGLIDYMRDRLQETEDYGYGECDRAEANGNPDAPKMKNKLDDIFEPFERRLANAEDYVERARSNRSFFYADETADGLYDQVKTDAENSRWNDRTYTLNGKTYSVNSIPETIDDAIANSYYTTAVKYFTKAVNLANRTLSDTSYEVVVTDEDLVDFVRNGYDFEVAGETSDLFAKGTALFYVDDNDFDESAYEDFFVEVLAEDGYELVELKSVKVVQAMARGDVDDMNGSTALDVYRVVYPIYTEIEETTEETTEEESNEETTEAESNDETTEEESTEETTEAESTEETTEGESTEETTEEESTEKPSEAEETTEGETNPEAPADKISIDVETETAFYFSHDPNAFDSTELIVSVKTEDDKYAVNYEHFSFGLDQNGPTEGLSPKNVYSYYYKNQTADGYKFEVAKPLYVYYNGEAVKDQNGEQATAYVYVGVKGDTDLSGETNAIDAANVLIYAAKKGAGAKPVIHSDYDKVLENFVYFLADTDTESKDSGVTDSYGEAFGEGVNPLNAVDSANILIFAAFRGSLGDIEVDGVPFAKVNWIDEKSDNNGVLTGEYPQTSLDIAVAAGLAAPLK